MFDSDDKIIKLELNRLIKNLQRRNLHELRQKNRKQSCTK